MTMLSPVCCLKVPGNSAKSGGSTHKKYVKMGGGPPVPSSKVFSQSEVIGPVLRGDWLATGRKRRGRISFVQFLSFESS